MLKAEKYLIKIKVNEGKQMKIHTIVCVLSLGVIISITGCNNKEENHENTDKTRLSEVNINETTATNNAKKDDVLLVQNVEKLKQQKSIRSSGDKLSYSSEGLYKGDKIYNHSIQQQGVVSGTLTLTLNTDSVPKDLSEAYELKALTAHNYLLIVEKKVEIAQLVYKLQNNNAVSNIEVKVDYSPIETHF